MGVLNLTKVILLLYGVIHTLCNAQGNVTKSPRLSRWFSSTGYQIEIFPLNILPKNCASIFLKNSTTPDLVVYPYKLVDKQELDMLHFNKTGYLRFEVGKEYDDPTFCRLQICGFQKTKKIQHECTLLGDFASSSGKIFSNDYIAESLGCACREPESSFEGCGSNLCFSENTASLLAWEGKECAVFYREPHCQYCYFEPVPLRQGYYLNTSRAHQIQSTIVRPGCQLEVHLPSSDDIGFSRETLKGIQDTLEKFYEESEQVLFRCQCEPDSFDSTNAISTTVKSKISDSNMTVQANSTNIVIWIVISFVSVVLIIGLFKLASIFVLKLAFQQKKQSDCENTVVSSAESLQSAISNYETDDVVTDMLSEFRRLFCRADCKTITMSSMLSIDARLNEICLPNQIFSNESIFITKQAYSNPIGVGDFGTVYKGLLSVPSQNSIHQVAIKIIKPLDGRQDLIESFLREVETFANTNEGHINVVQFFGACSNADGLYILTEYCDKGSLRNYLIRQLRPKYLCQPLEFQPTNDETCTAYYVEVDWPNVSSDKLLDKNDFRQMLEWCEQIAAGMEFLVSKQIIHVDLATRNVLLSTNMTAKICDLGLSRKCMNAESGARSLVQGNFPYNSYAPELVQISPSEPVRVSFYVDIWAYGCTLWEMFTLGESLYPTANQTGLERLLTIRTLLQEKYRHPQPKFCPDLVYQKMLECWNEVPQNRPNFSNLRETFVEYTKELDLC